MWRNCTNAGSMARIAQSDWFFLQKWYSICMRRIKINWKVKKACNSSQKNNFSQAYLSFSQFGLKCCSNKSGQIQFGLKCCCNNSGQIEFGLKCCSNDSGQIDLSWIVAATFQAKLNLTWFVAATFQAKSICPELLLQHFRTNWEFCETNRFLAGFTQFFVPFSASRQS